MAGNLAARVDREKSIRAFYSYRGELLLHVQDFARTLCNDEYQEWQIRGREVLPVRNP
jgi:hypothetical protein